MTAGPSKEFNRQHNFANETATKKLTGGNAVGLRGHALAELVAEVLGPRNGPGEHMIDDPVNEYITGVLRPEPTTSVPLDDLEVDDLVLDATSSDEEDDDDPAPMGALPVSPSIDPLQLPPYVGPAPLARSLSHT